MNTQKVIQQADAIRDQIRAMPKASTWRERQNQDRIRGRLLARESKLRALVPDEWEPPF